MIAKVTLMTKAFRGYSQTTVWPLLNCEGPSEVSEGCVTYMSQ